MNIRSIKTHRVKTGESIVELLDTYVKQVPEGSVLVVSSKIVALGENRVASNRAVTKEELVEQESHLYLPLAHSSYETQLTIANNTLVAAAGIDESNTDADFVLWPTDPKRTADTLRDYLKKRFAVSEVGVLITDSIVLPLRWGTIGISLGTSGFETLIDYVGQPDLYGRPFKVSQLSVSNGLAAAANLVMGEGTESTPFAVITDIPFVRFTDQKTEEPEMTIEEDLYAPFLQSVKWRKGRGV